MPLIVRSDEQIKVGVTPGLVVGASSFTFDGTLGKPDYRNTEIVISEVAGRAPMVKGVDYSWNRITANFVLLQVEDVLTNGRVYDVHFQPFGQLLTFNHYSFINSSFFVRDINIPNTKELQIIERLNSFIVKYEPECMVKLLGYSLYNLLVTESSTRMYDLIFGALYTNSEGHQKKWKGLVYETNQSLIAYYVYYYFQEASATQTTGVSTKVSKSEAGTSVSPVEKMISAWNIFSSEAYEMSSFLWIKKDINGVKTFPEFTNDQFFKSRDFSRKNNIFSL